MVNKLKKHYKSKLVNILESDLSDIFSLGNQYINDFPPSKDLIGRNGECNLDMVYCSNCDLYQLRHCCSTGVLLKTLLV